MGNQILGMTILAEPAAAMSPKTFEPKISEEGAKAKKPCRACTDFKSWSQQQAQKRSLSSEPLSGSRNNPVMEETDAELARRRAHLQCPLDKDELGTATWSFLHTMAGYFPDKATKIQQKEMSAFMKIFAKYYPCEHCAEDFQRSLKESPPETCGRVEFSQWMCKMHNEVNRKLGKPEFDCRRVDERWTDGWNDGSCDF